MTEEEEIEMENNEAGDKVVASPSLCPLQFTLQDKATQSAKKKSVQMHFQKNEKKKMKT